MMQGRRSVPVVLVLLAVGAATACVQDPVHWAGDAHAPPPVIGAAWVPPAIPSGTPVCAGSVSGARARGDTAFAAWWAPRADSSASLVVARSTDGGRTWGAPVVADSTDRGRSGCRRGQPSIAADSTNGYVHVVYFMVAPEGPGLFFTHSMEGGTMFHAPVPVVYGERPSSGAVASHGDTVVVAYEDPNASAPQIRLALSHSTGHIFEDRSTVSPVAASSTRPLVALHGDSITVSWYQTALGGGPGSTVVRTGALP
jgi:hypothetical protein